MDLFDKINLFYKKAQELKAPLDDKGVAGKPIIPSKSLPEGGGYPSALIRAAAKSVLARLVSNPAVPKSEKKDFNKLGDYLSDFLNERFADKDLNLHWGSYLSSLMNSVNHLKKDAATKELGDFYQSLYDVFSNLWDDIDRVQAWKTKAVKPKTVDWIGAAKPWGDDNTEGQLDEIAKKKLQETGTTFSLKTTK